jgi:hypothetical protein
MFRLTAELALPHPSQDQPNLWIVQVPLNFFVTGDVNDFSTRSAYL